MGKGQTVKFNIRTLIQRGLLCGTIYLGLTLAAVACLLPTAEAKVLNVRLVEQEQTNWCWAGSNAMVLRYYGTLVAQCDMANFAAEQSNHTVDDCCLTPGDCNLTNDMGDYPWSMQNILQNWGVDSVFVTNALTKATVENETDNNRPFLMGWFWTSGGGHALVGRGIEGDDVYYVDPWPGEGYKVGAYAYVAQSSNHEWAESLQITTPFVIPKTMPWIPLLLLSDDSPVAPVTIKPFDYNIIDAEYSKSLDKIITVSADPHRLHVYDPESEASIDTVLSLAPTCVSVGPDGLHAAVGHNEWVSYVNLSTASVEKTLSVSTDVIDIVLAGNGYAYAFPRTDQWEKIRCIMLETGSETLQTGNSIYAGTKAKLHPSGNAIYGAQNGISPSDIEKYAIVGGTAEYQYNSPYHGQYAMFGNLWISEDGLWIVTRGGNVFDASAQVNQDMLYNCALSALNRVEHLSHSGAVDKLIAIPGIDLISPDDEDQEVQIYDSISFNYERKVSLPMFKVNGRRYPGHGRYVFFNREGNAYYVILQADESAGLANDFGIATYQP